MFNIPAQVAWKEQRPASLEWRLVCSYLAPLASLVSLSTLDSLHCIDEYPLCMSPTAGTTGYLSGRGGNEALLLASRGLCRMFSRFLISNDHILLVLCITPRGEERRRLRRPKGRDKKVVRCAPMGERDHDAHSIKTHRLLTLLSRIEAKSVNLIGPALFLPSLRPQDRAVPSLRFLKPSP